MFSFWFDVNTNATPKAELETFAPDPVNDTTGILYFNFPPALAPGASAATRPSDQGIPVQVTLVRRPLE